MMRNWKKAGLVVKPDPKLWWMQTHAMVPTPEQIFDSLYRIYFSGRDNKNRSQIGYCVIDLREPNRVLEISSEPVLSPGELGCFDDNGVTPSCVVKNGNETHLYYIGWNPGSTTRMNIFGGLARSGDGGRSFQRYSRAPVLERCRANPYINTAPFALREAEGDWKIYYVSGTAWLDKDHPKYNIQLGYSKDGLEWKREGHVCIDFGPGETSLARPYVIRELGIYKMWYASKGEAYRIRYAESPDGLNWTRRDDLFHIEPTPGSYDSDMMEYAVVLNHGGSKIMFYNGNNYGVEGIALAIQE